MIDLIDEVTAVYKKRLYGSQEKIQNTPFVALLGVMNTEGELVEYGEDYEFHPLKNFTLVANTNDQLIRTITNKKFRTLTLLLRQSAAVTSYDWKIVSYIMAGRAIPMDFNSTKTWSANAIASTNVTFLHGPFPMGMPDTFPLVLYADNNHVGTDITLQTAYILSDPVR